MKRVGMACAVMAVLGAMQTAAIAAPVQIDFNVAGFGPANPGTSFTKNDVIGTVDFTFTGYNDAAMSQLATLWWDAGDEFGFPDGFGVNGTGYSSDEVDGNERLALTFSEAVHLYGFNLTDFFHEQEPSLENCQIGTPNCYIETGSYLLLYGDGTNSGWLGFNAFLNANRSTNGLFNVEFNAPNVIGILFQAPGITPGAFADPYAKMEDYSLAGIKVDVTTVHTPEPASLALLGLGLSGVAAVGRRRRRQQQSGQQ